MDKALLLDRLKLYSKRTLIVLGVFLGVTALFALMGAGTLGYLEWSARRDTPANHRAAVEAAQAWGQLAPLPVKAEDLTLKTGGSPFKRKYQLSFEAEPEAIQLWVARSPGLAGFQRPRAKSVSTILAHGADGKGACKVTWSHGASQIDIEASWD
jgi:hypothetical protein